MVFVYACALVPVFCTLGQLPKHALEQQAELLLAIEGALMKSFRGRVQQVARFPEQTAHTLAEPDELRLFVTLEAARAGLLAIEVGVAPHQSALPGLPLPVIVVRVREGSAAHDAMPRSAEWSRGRDCDERVAMLRPMLPSVVMAVDLVRGLVRALSLPAEPPSARTRHVKKAASSRGKSDTALNAGTVVPPAQATRLA
jgi:hypothetical protein